MVSCLHSQVLLVRSALLCNSHLVSNVELCSITPLQGLRFQRVLVAVVGESVQTSVPAFLVSSFRVAWTAATSPVIQLPHAFIGVFV